MKTPLLSVVCITYNHEYYIAQAIESWLMQKTNFEIEIVIGEDCSTDNTRNIIEQYRQKRPDIIHVITSEANVGMMPNFIRTLKACKGKYIALCEGDDYWTDPLKLQKQVDFLEENIEYSICFHSIMVLKDMTLFDDQITRKVSQSTDISELLNGNYIHTPSVVFRNNFHIQSLPINFSKSPVGDYYLHLFNSQFGKIFKIMENMAVYRYGGNWSLDTVTKEKKLMLLKTIKLASDGLNSNLKITDEWYRQLIYFSQTDLSNLIFIESEFEKELNDIFTSSNLSKTVKTTVLIKSLLLKLQRFLK